LSAVSDWNRGVIEEFRANQGKVGGPQAGRTLLLLHHRGARTGKERVNPLVYITHGDDMVVFASKGGAPTNPDWYHNLIAHPDVSVEVGTDTVAVHARVPERPERDLYWNQIKEAIPAFAEYENKTDRVIPAIVLERV
jgi:deazaflavin-dependent oxidoreductase (nitroreductase family)